MKSKRVFPYYLYHICREKDKYNLSVGYVGVSNKPKKRWSSGGYKNNPHLVNALVKYDDIIKYVVKVGTRSECLSNELKLRPTRNIGWNIARGGGIPPSPRETGNCISKIPKEKRRKDYSVTEETRMKMKKAQEGFREFHSERMKGNKNPMHNIKGKDHPTFKGYYITPKGRFETSSEVEKAFGISKPTVQRRCKIGGVVGHSRWNPKSYRGKTWEELGWSFESKEEVEG